MSRNRNLPVDHAKTAQMMEAVPFDRKRKKNWLGHSKGAAYIDVMLLIGATMDQMRSPDRPTVESVQDHLRHLEQHHGLLLVFEGGLHRFGNPPIAG